MYAAVPKIIPFAVITGLVIVGDIDELPAAALNGSAASAFARPKSSTFTVPSGRILTLAAS